MNITAEIAETTEPFLFSADSACSAVNFLFKEAGMRNFPQKTR
jgi:hypothetical protein